MGKTGMPAAMAAEAISWPGSASSGFESSEEFFGAGAFVVQVVADGGGCDAEVVEKLLGLARVLAGDAIGGAQDAEGAEGDVLEVADGGGDEIEARGEALVAFAFVASFA
jgi:hypothetical protein